MKFRAIISYFMAYLIALQPVFAARIVPDGGNTNLGTPSGANNIPVLNIDAPTSAGVSHNKFQDFNVDGKGLIINNLNMQNYNPNYKSSLSGEHVEFNYNFKTGDAAKVILNEVVSNSVSELRGTTEIYGQKADYIVANPNGITCAGCGFINTGRLSLITGSSNMVGGDINSFNISTAGVLQINGVGIEAFGMHAITHADLVSNAIRIAGNIHVDGDLSLYSGNDKFDYKNKIVSSDNNAGISVAIDSTAIGGMKANNIKIIATQKGFGINTNGNLVADMGNVEITADGDIVMKNVAAKEFVNIKSISQNVKSSAGDIYAQNIKIDVAKDFTNDQNNHIVAQKDIEIRTGENIKNIGKINAGNNIDLNAGNVHNYGQILGSKLTFTTDNDLINYRGAGILSAGDINFNIGRDLINYKAEIFALGNINIQGRDDLTVAPSGLSIASENMASMAAKYDNPYIDAETTPVINPPVITPPLPDEEDADIDIQFELSDGTIITMPFDAFLETDTAGATYTNADGYIFIIGQEISTLVDNPAYQACVEDPGCDETLVPAQITEYTYVGIDTFTIKDKTPDADGNHPTIYATFLNLDDEIGSDENGTSPNPSLAHEDIPIQDNGDVFSSDLLDEKKSILDGYVFNDNLMGTFLNWAGRIESGKDMEINAAKIINKGFDINTGASAVDKIYTSMNPVLHSYWRVNGYESITGINLDSIAAQLVSGRDLTLNGHDILNQSGVISSKGNMVLNATNSIKNQTYSEIATLRIDFRRRKWKAPKYRYYNKSETEQKRIYSAQRSMIISGVDLKLKSTTLENDQVLDPLAGFDLNLPMPDDVKGGISVNTRLPVGDNGLFHVVPDGKYLVETNVSFIDPNDFIGSDYFFVGLGDGKSAIDTTRILGDAAYETRLITDAYVKATGQHWTDNEGKIGSDTDMMKSLYDAAIDASRDMQLTVGIALTSEQIANLQQDIIWYVKEEVDGHTVLVPKLYLAQATLDSLDGASGSKITGVTVSAENQFMINVGTISAEDILQIDTKTLINESNDQLASLTSGGALIIDANRVENRSASISGDTVSIKADELVNETKKLVEDRAWSGGDDWSKEHIEQASNTATISGTNGVDIELTGKLTNTGAKMESENGNINITADEVVFDTLRLFNSSESQSSSSNIGGSKTTTNVSQSLTNVGSEINSGGNLNITTKGDATFAGTTINVGGNADLDIGGDTNIIAVMDESYSYSKTEKSSWGGLVKEESINEISDQNLKSSSLNVVDGLKINTGNNLNLIASEINVDGNADIDAGNNINILSAAEVDTAYSYYKKTNYVEDLAKAAGTLALAAVTGGASLLFVNDGIDVDCSGGKCGASVVIGSQTEDESFTKKTTSVASGINVGGNLTMDAVNDINIKGSDINVGGDGSVKAGNNINILASQNSTEHTESHSDTTVTAGVQVGNAYVDVGMAAIALYEAGDAAVKASEELKRIKELRDQGKASDEAVRDAELNLTMAGLNLLNAELAAVSSMAGAGAATGTSFGTGMYTSASLNFETNKDSSSLNSTESVASNISGNNLTFTSGNNMTQVGSNVLAEEKIKYDIQNDLNVLASTDTYRTTSSSENITAGVSVGNNAVQINAGYNQSQNKASGTSHNNSNISANEIEIITGGDAKFSGADVHADDKLKMDIGGDLTVESLQDTDYAKGNSWGVNAGFGLGYGESVQNGKTVDHSGDRNASVGFNVGKSNHDSAWVNNQTEITGGTVDINVDKKTSIIGSVISSDTGDLNIITKELEYKDINDFNNYSDSGFGLSTHIGGSTDKDKATLHPEGTTNISVKDKSSESEQINHATIGGGNIVVNGESNPKLNGLNRDIDKSQEITKDVITGAVDYNLEIDNRVFTSDGRNNIANQHENFVDNAIVGLGDAWNLPNTAIGAAWGGLGMILGDATHYYDEENRVHVFMNNPIGRNGTAGTMGNTINFNGTEKEFNESILSYAYKESSYTARMNGVWMSSTYLDEVDFKTHELKHRDQGQYLGISFLPVYLISGGNSASNWMERQADKAGNDAYMLKLNGGK